MVERPRARWLPFSAWHLLLMPVALVMLVPLVWVVMTSLESLAQTQHFPPILWPGTFQWSNYPRAWSSAPFGTWFCNTTVVTTTVVVVSNLLLCSLAAYAFARIRFLGKSVVYFLLARDADGAAPGRPDPHVPDREAAGPHQPPRRA